MILIALKSGFSAANSRLMRPLRRSAYLDASLLTRRATRFGFMMRFAEGHQVSRRAFTPAVNQMSNLSRYFGVVVVRLMIKVVPGEAPEV
jgi:hypothetical protein